MCAMQKQVMQKNSSLFLKGLILTISMCAIQNRVIQKFFIPSKAKF